MKAYHDKTETTIKSMNDHIASMIATLIDTGFKTNKQDKKTTDLSLKL